MVKVCFFVRRSPHLSREQFIAHWRGRHGALIAKHAATFGLVRYLQVHPLATPRNEPSEVFPEPFDGVAELWFKGQEELESWFSNNTPETRAAGREIREDERTFIDRARSPFLIGEEDVVIPGP